MKPVLCLLFRVSSIDSESITQLKRQDGLGFALSYTRSRHIISRQPAAGTQKGARDVNQGGASANSASYGVQSERLLQPQ